MLKSRTLAKDKPIEKVSLTSLIEHLSDEELISLRTKIDLKLSVDLSRINLAEEIGMQYRSAMVLLQSIQDDKEVPANQRAQVLNSVRTTLADIIRQQKVVYSAERQKRYEVAIKKVLEQLPPESTRIFFDLYGEFLAQEVEVIPDEA